MTIHIKQHRGGGWLSRQGAAYSSRQLRLKLEKELEDKNSVFITLTYGNDRTPEENYDEASRNKAVSRFMSHLAMELNTDFSGKWICKLEFQTNGQPHFHIIVKDTNYIPHDVMERVWGRGFVWITASRENGGPRSAARYFSKKLSHYTAKPLQVPYWLLQRRVGTVKIVRTSPGFWSVNTVRYKDNVAMKEFVPPNAGFPVYMTIGNKLDIERDKIEIYCDQTKASGTIDGLKLSDLQLELASTGTYTGRSDYGTETYNLSYSDALDAAASAAWRARRAIHLKNALNRASNYQLNAYLEELVNT